MTSSWLLLRIVELAITYLVHSTLFLGAIGILLVAVARSRRNKSSAGNPACNPLVEERLWKLGATLPLLSVPLSIFAGLSCELSSEVIRHQYQSASAVRLDDSSSAKKSATNIQGNVATPRKRSFNSAIAPANNGSTVHDRPFPIPQQDNLAAETVPISKGPLDHSIELNPSSADLAEHDQQTSLEVMTSYTSAKWLGLAFVCWTIVSICRLTARALLVHRFLRRCDRANSDLQNILHRLTNNAHLIRLLRGPAGATSRPFACGIWRWTIVLPNGIEEQLPPAEIRALLAHEVAHLVRRDPLWLFVGELLCTILAVQPLNFIARRRWLQAAELLCDDWAVQQNVSATSLATCLTRIAELRMDHRNKTWGLAAMGRSGLLTRRIEWLLRDDRQTESTSMRHPCRTAVVACIATLLIAAFGPRFVIPAAAESVLEVAANPDQLAIVKDLSIALDELQSTESLIARDSDPQVAHIAKRLRARIQSIHHRLDALDAVNPQSSSR